MKKILNYFISLCVFYGMQTLQGMQSGDGGEGSSKIYINLENYGNNFDSFCRAINTSLDATNTERMHIRTESEDFFKAAIEAQSNDEKEYYLNKVYQLRQQEMKLTPLVLVKGLYFRWTFRCDSLRIQENLLTLAISRDGFISFYKTVRKSQLQGIKSMGLTAKYGGTKAGLSETMNRKDMQFDSRGKMYVLNVNDLSGYRSFIDDAIDLEIRIPAAKTQMYNLAKEPHHNWFFVETIPVEYIYVLPTRESFLSFSPAAFEAQEQQLRMEEEIRQESLKAQQKDMKVRLQATQLVKLLRGNKSMSEYAMEQGFKSIRHVPFRGMEMPMGVSSLEGYNVLVKYTRHKDGTQFESMGKIIYTYPAGMQLRDAIGMTYDVNANYCSIDEVYIKVP